MPNHTKLITLVSALTLVGIAPSFAQPNPGFIIFGNSKDTAMDYCLDSGSASQYDSYYLELKTQKFKYSEIIVTYPDHFNPMTDFAAIELFQNSDCRGGKKIPLESAQWDKEARRITVIPKEPIPANTPVRLVLSNVRNPNFPGMFQIDARVLRADVPVPVYIGSWIISLQ